MEGQQLILIQLTAGKYEASAFWLKVGNVGDWNAAYAPFSLLNIILVYYCEMYLFNRLCFAWLAEVSALLPYAGPT